MNLFDYIIITTFIITSFQLNTIEQENLTERRNFAKKKINEDYYLFCSPIWTALRKNKDFDRIIKKELEKEQELTEEGIKREWILGCLRLAMNIELGFTPRFILLELITSTSPILASLFLTKKYKKEKFKADFSYIKFDLLCALKYSKGSEVLPYIPNDRKSKILEGINLYNTVPFGWRTFYCTKNLEEMEKARRKKAREENANEILENIKKNEESELLITHSVVLLAMRSHTYASIAIFPVFNYLCNHGFSKFINYITNFVYEKCIYFFKSDKKKKQEAQKAIFKYEDMLDNLEVEYEERDSWEKQDSSEYAESFEEYEEKRFLNEEIMSESSFEENNQKNEKYRLISQENIDKNTDVKTQAYEADFKSKLRFSSISKKDKRKNSEIGESGRRFDNDYIDNGFYKMRCYRRHRYCPKKFF
ncbi:uncharacterized protein VNE69_06210 [Vairimorpha necatrix]|uniref:Uncharacterized protein n=1 Tax=Vairimorpha necatrix TaxID=6039 RepID=A0AAX4JD24_9MICR